MRIASILTLPPRAPETAATFSAADRVFPPRTKRTMRTMRTVFFPPARHPC
jgi:hypothetical protein